MRSWIFIFVKRQRLGIIEPAEVGHDVDDLCLLVQAAFLRELAEPVTVLRFERPAVDVQGPAGRLVDAQQRPDGRRLPGPVAAQETKRLTPGHGEGQIPNDCFAPEIHPEILDMDECFAHGFSPKMCRKVVLRAYRGRCGPISILRMRSVRRSTACLG
jgi:hypothetical protein